MGHELKIKIQSQNGLHARPAGLIAKTASEYKSQVSIIARGQTKNAKSIMNIMTFGLQHNEDILFTADGEDAPQALAAISQLFASDFQV